MPADVLLFIPRKPMQKITPVLFVEEIDFYGADELIVREPAGNVVTFAQFA